jgi:hypothetical protein
MEYYLYMRESEREREREMLLSSERVKPHRATNYKYREKYIFNS